LAREDYADAAVVSFALGVHPRRFLLYAADAVSANFRSDQDEVLAMTETIFIIIAGVLFAVFLVAHAKSVRKEEYQDLDVPLMFG